MHVTELSFRLYGKPPGAFIPKRAGRCLLAGSVLTFLISSCAPFRTDEPPKEYFDCRTKIELKEKIEKQVCLSGQAGVGKQGLYVCIDHTAVYLKDEDDKLLPGRALITSSAHKHAIIRIFGVLHYAKRRDFRTGLGCPMRDHYWMTVSRAEALHRQ